MLQHSVLQDITVQIRSLPDNLLEVFEGFLDPDPRNRLTREGLEQLAWLSNI
jgi:hypothetical protein